MFGPYAMSPAYSRKIDLLVKCESATPNSVVEICSSEFKRHSVLKSIMLSQQSKNMRINVTILFRNALHGMTDIMYFDVFGSDLYCFYLKWLPQHEIYLGSLVNNAISVPMNALFLDNLPDLITTLFAFKKFVLDQEKSLKRAIYKQQSRKRSAEIVDVTILQDNRHSYPPARNDAASREGEVEDQED